MLEGERIFRTVPSFLSAIPLVCNLFGTGETLQDTRGSRLRLSCSASLSPRSPGYSKDYRKRPYGYWKKAENVLSELRDFVQSHGQHPNMPTGGELVAAGRQDLASAISRYSSWEDVAQRAGLVLSSITKPRSLNLVFCTDLQLKSGGMKPHNHWRDFSNLEKELTAFIFSNESTPGDVETRAEEPGEMNIGLSNLELHRKVMPSASFLKSSGRSDLIRAIGIHGGFRDVASRMGLIPSGEYWGDFSVVEAEVKRIIREHMPSECAGQMPTLATIKEKGYPGLFSAVGRKHGGSQKVAKRMGLLFASNYQSWECFEQVQEEIRRIIIEHMPPEKAGEMLQIAEINKHGKPGLIQAIRRSHGGLANVARQMGLVQHHRGRPAVERTRKDSTEVNG